MEFRILGPLEVRADGREVRLGGAKPRALLAMLLLRANEPVSAERLALGLWGEDAPPGAVKTVQVHVSRLRKALADHDVLATTPAGYCLRVRPGELDVERFERQVADGREALAAGRAEEAAASLRDALALWRGAPLDDVAALPFAPAQIARLEELYLQAVEMRVDADLAAGRHSESVGELQQLTAEQPLRERLHGQLMLALYRSGRQADALEAYRLAREVLVEQLGIEPGAELREVHQAILAQDASIDAPPTAAGPGGRRSALPAPPTALFGREADVDGLTRAVSELRTRLVTLVGPGGVGKTRLAIEAARRLEEDFPDGARFVALASLSEPRELASAIARQLDAPVRSDEAAESALLRYLGDRHLLLVLDNFEQLLAAAPLVAELIAACPGLTILASSREPLRLTAERLYPVQPLEVPPPDEDAAADSERYGAVAVFCDRARARDPHFALEPGNAPHVHEICRRLDGLPLAIELAAARVGLLSPAELNARLDAALTVLAGGARDAPERQRTLRATIDWSYRLLTEAEGRAFTHLAVFAAGATVAAAEAVTGASLDTLHSLVAKQLLVRRDGRLHMLDTVRAYALERLGEDPEADAVRDSFAAWCLDFLGDATPHLEQADSVNWEARLDAELPNAQAALAQALADSKGQRALELAVALAPYWWNGRQSDGRPWIEAALDAAPDVPARLRARALLSQARLTGPRADVARYRSLLDASLELYRELEDPAGMAECMGQVAVLHRWTGDELNGAALAQDALRLARRSGDPAAVAKTLAWGVQATTGYEATAALGAEAVRNLRAVGNEQRLAWVCSDVGYKAIAAGRQREALKWLEQGHETARRVDNPVSIFSLCTNQGLAWLFLDEPDDAAEAFSEALAVCRRAATEHVVDETLLGTAAVAARRQEYARAASLAGAAKGHEIWRNRDEDVIWMRLTDEILTPARERYGPEKWDPEEREGASLTAHDAIDLALARGRFASRAPSCPGR